MPALFLKQSLAYKISLMMVLVAVFTAIIVTTVFYLKTRDILLEHTLNDLSFRLEREGAELTIKTETLRKHVRFLAGTPPIQGIINAKKAGGRDVQGNTVEQWRERLGIIFSNLVAANTEYLQIRYIDAAGNELVRVEQENSSLKVVRPDDLQNKAASDYVTRTLELAKNEVFLSEINLNRERGEIMIPHVPVLRAATPVFDNVTGKVAGLVIINLDFAAEASRIRKAHPDADKELYITDHRGSYLSHPDKNKEYGFDLGRRFRIQEDVPQIASFFLPENRQKTTTVTAERDGESYISVFNKVPLGSNSRGRFVAIGLTQKYSDVVAYGQDALKDTLTLALILVLVGSVLAFVFARSISVPIQQLTQGIDRFRLNSDSSNLPVDRQDELGKLARAFSEMMEYVIHSQNDLRQLNRNLENLVEERTRQASDAQVRVQTIIDTVVDGIITINEEGLIQTFNHAAETMFGYQSNEVIGHNIKMLMPEKYSSEHDGYLSHYKQTGEKHIIGKGREVEGMRKDGSVFPMDLAVSNMNIGGELFYTGIVRDITERKRVDVMKNEFISTVSHELRTPLTSIRGALGLITGGAAGELPGKAKEMLSIALNNTQRLLLLINDILDLQKIESGNMAFKFAAVNLDDLVRQAIKDNAYYGEENNVEFVLARTIDKATVFADHDRLMQTLTNLMSNAAKFSRPDSKVELSIAEHEGMYRVSVTDYGCGIPEEFKDKLFEKFSQADSSSTRQIGGTGLGLNIARLLVERHGGRIGFVSREGVGSTFYFELPVLYSKTPGNDAGQPGKNSAGKHSTILVVEDEPDNAMVMQRHFAEAGFDSVVAGSVADAMGILNDPETELRLMTLDIRLPDGHGLELLEYVRQHDRYADLPVIIVSVFAEDEREKNSTGTVDVVDWIPKPIDEERLMMAIKSAATGNRKPRVLHVEDDPDIHKLVLLMIQDECDVIWTTSVKATREVLQLEDIDLVLLDISLPDGSGLELIDQIEVNVSPPKVVIFSAQDVDSRVASRVEAVLVKSQATDEDLIKTMVSVLDRHSSDKS